MSSGAQTPRSSRQRKAFGAPPHRQNPSGASLDEKRESERDRERDLGNLAHVQRSRPLVPPGRRA